MRKECPCSEWRKDVGLVVGDIPWLEEMFKRQLEEGNLVELRKPRGYNKQLWGGERFFRCVATNVIWVYSPPEHYGELSPLDPEDVDV